MIIKINNFRGNITDALGKTRPQVYLCDKMSDFEAVNTLGRAETFVSEMKLNVLGYFDPV